MKRRAVLAAFPAVALMGVQLPAASAATVLPIHQHRLTAEAGTASTISVLAACAGSADGLPQGLSLAIEGPNQRSRHLWSLARNRLAHCSRPVSQRISDANHLSLRYTCGSAGCSVHRLLMPGRGDWLLSTLPHTQLPPAWRATLDVDALAELMHQSAPGAFDALLLRLA